jgi:hypothetical protein
MASSTGTSIANRYGSSASNFTVELANGAEKIMVEWANASILIMRKILSRKTRIGDRGKLIADLAPKPYPMSSDGKLKIEIVTMQDHWEFLDKGVQGVKSQRKAPNSPFKFKNLGVPKKMLRSFVDYAARTGVQEVRGTTLATKGKSKIKAGKDILKVAKGLAIATKLSGIKPVNYIEPAVGEKRLKILSKSMSKELGKKVLASIVSEF